MKALIVTHSRDNDSVEMVSRALEKRGAQAFRFNTDLFPTEVSIRIALDRSGETVEIETAEGTVDARELAGAWHRRIAIASAIPSDMDKQVRFAAVEESRRVVNGMLVSLPCFVLDTWPRLRIAENKQLQLELARAAGLDVPKTLVTNDPAAARAFWHGCKGRVVTKMMASFAIYEEGQEKVVFTNPVTEKDLDGLDGLRFCPMTFQEVLDKSVELRVTVVGERVFTAAIDSNQMERSKTDWRREGSALLSKWTKSELPQDVERGMLKVMDALGLNYGAADFIVTPEGRTVFLEVNPAGEFFWLERENGLPISEAIADVLLGKAKRREAKLHS
ncbi:MAG: MvdC/MvdD family ATP grasp protein [Planctomycetota bacterium]